MDRDRRPIMMMLAQASLFAGTALAEDDVVVIDPAQVPAAVRQAAQKAAPGARLSEVLTDRGRTVFLLAGRDARDREVRVEASARGKVDSVATTIVMSDVPPAILGVVKKHGQGKSFTRVMSVVGGDGKMSYRFEGPNERGEVIGLLDIQAARQETKPARED